VQTSLGEDRQIGVQPNPIQTTDVQRSERPIVLEAPELALDGGTAAVQGLPPGRFARDEWEHALSLDPD
jgi:hypothetical protein